MLLRSVTLHLKEQNWTAIVLDFAIVVLGVFIGIQVANWNEARLEERQEALLLERLQVDFARIEEDAQRSLDYHQQMLLDLRTLVHALRSGSLAEKDEPAIDRALFLGLSLQTSADRSGTFTELLSSGRANLLSDKDLLNELVAYEDFLERFKFAQEFLMGLILGTQQPFTAAFQYDVDALFFNGELQIDSANVPGSVYDFGAMVDDAPFHEATEQLVFAHSITLLWRSRVSERVRRIQQLLTEASS